MRQRCVPTGIQDKTHEEETTRPTALQQRKTKGSRRPKLRLECEELEARIVLSGEPNWGINLDGNVDWASMGGWVDVGKTFRRWGDINAPWLENPALTFTDQGIPLQDAGAIAFLRGYGGGIYSLRYEGTGNVTFSHRAGIVPGSLQTVGGVTTALVDVDEAEGLVHFELRNVNPNDPVRNLRLIAPGYDVNTTQVFRDEFLKRLQPFSTLRFMDWNRTNNSQASNWNQRRQADEFIQTAGPSDPAPGGVAWEYMIALANAADADAWINVPHLVAAEAVNNPAANDAGETYIRELARLWRDNLDPNLKVIVEYSNEPWNPQFQQGQGGQHDYYTVVGPRLEKISDLFHEEFAGQEHRLEIVLAGQNANSFHARRALEYLVDQGRVPGTVIDAVASAPYFQAPSTQAFTELDSLFNSLVFTMDGVSAHKALADQYGLKLYTYEGGQHLVPGATSQALLMQAQNDPRMGAAYEHNAALWDEVGGDLFMHFSMTSVSGPHGFWGLLEDDRDIGSVKWDAVMRIVLPAGDASLDGSVGFDDFETLSDNFGTGSWWEQGDSDGDNDVDGDDFFRLFHNLDLGALTTAQTDEIYAFAAAHNISVPPLDAPVVTITASDAVANEELGDPAEFTFTRDDTTGLLTVSYVVGGTVQSNDYRETLTGSITFADGSATATLRITPLNDFEPDYGDTLTLTLALGTDYFVGQPRKTTITILDDEPLVYDGFDAPAGTLQGTTSGWGWDDPWLIWQHNPAQPQYQVVGGNSIEYEGLYHSGGHIEGGGPPNNSFFAGREIDLGGALAAHVNPDTGLLGRDGTTLWLSMLVTRHVPAGQAGPLMRISLHGDSNATAEWTRDISMGYFRWPSDLSGVGYWSLQMDTPGGQVTARSNVAIVMDQPTLLVMRIDFGPAGDLATLYVNPELGVAPPAGGDAQLLVENIDIQNVAFNFGQDPRVASMDEIRLGGSFASITPAAPVPVAVTAEQAPDQEDPTDDSSLRFIVTFARPVVGFTSQDVVLSGSAGATTALVTEMAPNDGSTYRVTVSGMTRDGTVQVTVPAGVVIGLDGSPNSASVSTDNMVFYDALTPVVSLTVPGLTNDDTPTVTIGASAGLSGAAGATAILDVDLNNDGDFDDPGEMAHDTRAITGSSVTFALGTALPSNATVRTRARVADALGNQGISSIATVVVDQTPPTAVIERATGQARVVATGPVRFEVVFSEPIVGFGPPDVVLGGWSEPATLTVTQIGPLDGTRFLVEIGGLSRPGTAYISLNSAAVVDSADNGNGAVDGASSQVFVGILIASSVDAGAEPRVHLFDAVTGQPFLSFLAYDAGFTGGVRVVLGDVTGDGIADVLTAPGPGLPGGARVKIFDGAALLQNQVTEVGPGILPYGESYTGEVFVAAGAFNGDAFADIVTGNRPGKGPTVKVFDGAGAQVGIATELSSFRPFGKRYGGGARVAAGDVNGDGIVDIIAAQSKNGALVQVYSGIDFTLLARVNASPKIVVKGGVFVAAGNFDGDERTDIVIGLGAGVKGRVLVYEDASDLNRKMTRLATSPVLYGNFKGGIRVAALDVDGNGRAEVLTAPGKGPHTSLFLLDAPLLNVIDDIFAEPLGFGAGLFVDGARLGV